MLDPDFQYFKALQDKRTDADVFLLAVGRECKHMFAWSCHGVGFVQRPSGLGRGTRPRGAIPARQGAQALHPVDTRAWALGAVR